MASVQWVVFSAVEAILSTERCSVHCENIMSTAEVTLSKAENAEMYAGGYHYQCRGDIINTMRVLVLQSECSMKKNNDHILFNI